MTAPSATEAHRGRLAVVLALTLGVAVLQIAGAIWANSLALLADAGHMLTDAAGISLALIASTLARRAATPKRSFGLLRVEVLAALINGLALTAIAIIVVVEGVRRLGTDPEILPLPMLAAAVLGALANLVALRLLRRGSRESLNVRGAYLEVFGDLLGSVAVIVAAITIAVTGWAAADQLASFAIAALIAPRAYALLRDVVHVLLEGAPDHLDLQDVRSHLESAPGVVDVHDLHAWTLTSGVHALSAHVRVDPVHLRAHGNRAVLSDLLGCLSSHFDTDHCTLQLEPADRPLHERGLHA